MLDDVLRPEADTAATRLPVHALDAAACVSHGERGTEFKSGWGGARKGAGRPPKPAKRVIATRPSGPRWHVLEIDARSATAIMQDVLQGDTRFVYPQGVADSVVFPSSLTRRPPFNAYLPTGTTVRVVRGQKVEVQRPMYPGYLFVQFDRERDAWATLTTVDGVRSIVATRSLIPIPLPPGFIEWLVDTEVERLKLPAVRMPRFDTGQRLVADVGPFAGHTAVCIACDGYLTRARVHVFGRDLEVEFPRRHFAAARIEA